MAQSYYRKYLEDYLAGLEIKADCILDVGGSQLPVKGRTKTWDVKEYLIADLENPHQGEKPDYIFDLNYGLEYEYNPVDKEYDIVFCLEVFEYVIDPICAMQNLSFLTKQNGILYITFPFLYPLHRPEGLDMLRYNKNSVYKLLKENGFEVLEYISRPAQFPEKYMDWVRAEQFRVKGFGIDQLSETGCIIKCIKGG